jgi:membrane protease YdiL (CAAX protease family)
MELFGPDFRAGLRAPLYRPFNPPGLRAAVFIFISLVLGSQLLQLVLGYAGVALSGNPLDDRAVTIRYSMVTLLPASLMTAYAAWVLASRNAVDRTVVLALRLPALGFLGWALVVVGFVVLLNLAIPLIFWLLRVDMPESGTVEQAMIILSDDPLYFLIAGGIVIGAPLWEEFTFRGQIFAALSQTRLGHPGTAVVTSALWAALHITQPIYFLLSLFLMGLVLSWLLIRFGSLWVTIACHALWNAVSAAILYSASPP